MEFKRHNFKWNINEVLKLQREYELLKMPIQKIAILHCRSVRAILCKLEREGFIENWEETNGYEEYINDDADLSFFASEILYSKNRRVLPENEKVSKEVSKEVSEDLQKASNKQQNSLGFFSNMIKNIIWR